MLRKYKKQREQLEFICTESVVLQNHLLRKIDAAVDFEKIYDLWKNYTVQIMAVKA